VITNEGHFEGQGRQLGGFIVLKSVEYVAFSGEDDF